MWLLLGLILPEVSTFCWYYFTGGLPKEKTPKDPTIREKFNTYRFLDYKEQVIELICRVCTVSIETMKIIREM